MKVSSEIDIESTKKVLLLDFHSFDESLKSMVEEHLVEICEGDSDTELDDVKKRIIHFLDEKSEKTKYGAIAEFFLHLILKILGFKQECLFLNLEENSIKKGFDGVYTQSSRIYLMESKSSLSATQDKSHKNNLMSAYKDLASYIDGTSKKGRNNPWRNAFNHASHVDVGTKKPLREKLRHIARLHDNHEYQSLADHDLIPCSTIYTDIESLLSFNLDVKKDYSFISEMDANSITAICVSNSACVGFLDYLGEING